MAIRFAENEASYTLNRGLHHAEELAKSISSLCHNLNIPPRSFQQVICALGPGSFTGLRIGMATAKGIVTAIPHCAFTAVSTLDAYAEGLLWFDGAVSPLVSARKEVFYTALYVDGKKVTEDLELDIDRLATQLAPYPRVLLTGPDAPLALSFLKERGYDNTLALDPLYEEGKASSFLRLGEEKLHREGPDDLSIGPLYLRKSAAEEKTSP